MARITLPKLTFTYYQKSTIALVVFAILILIIGQLTNLDLVIEDYYFDINTQQFPWNDTWFANDFMHGYVKIFIKYCGQALWLVVMLDLIYPWRFIDTWLRFRLRFVMVASIIIPALISAIKQISFLHCPFDVDRYGGYAPFMRLFDGLPEGVKAGHCFPAGHATVGLWLAAICVFWLPNKPKVAFAIFTAGLSVGFTLGWVQQMRGAHFLFHTLWSTWFAAFVGRAETEFFRFVNAVERGTKAADSGRYFCRPTPKARHISSQKHLLVTRYAAPRA